MAALSDPLERFQVDGVATSPQGIDQQTVSQVVVASSLGKQDVDEILGRQRAEVSAELLSGALISFGMSARR